MSHKFSPEHFAKLDNPWRRGILPPKEVLTTFGLKEFDTFADIGCGVGYFTLPAAEIVGPDTPAYGLDISDVMLKELEIRSNTQALTNLKLIQTEEYDLKLMNASVTFALVVNVLHEIEDQQRFVSELSRILDVGSKLSIIEWHKKPMDYGPPVDHRLSQEDLIALLETQHFTIQALHDFSSTFYGIVAEKKL